MNHSHVRIKELYSFVHRRINLLLIPPIIVTVLSAVGTIYLPKLYESTIRILIQNTDVPNPLTSLANAMNEKNVDPLRLFEEIIFSQRTFEQIMDSLGLSSQVHNEVDRREMMVRINNGIQTKMQGNESFSITYQDEDPERAQRGASLLANIFIRTVANAKNQQNTFTVSFYDKKLEEFRVKMDENQKKVANKIEEKNKEGEGAKTILYARILQIDQKIQESKNQINSYQEVLNSLQSFPAALNTTEGRQTLFEVQRSNVPYAQDLRPLLITYEDISQKYTTSHPEVLKVQNQIVVVLERMKIAVNAEIVKLEADVNTDRQDKTTTYGMVLNSSQVRQSDRDAEENFLLYQRLYNEMKIKLEEAQISKVLGANSQGQYIIMDPAMLPLFPSKPSVPLIVGGGFFLGIILGLLSALMAEFLDTTIRTPQSVEIYDKPIIAFLPEA